MASFGNPKWEIVSEYLSVPVQAETALPIVVDGKGRTVSSLIS